MGDSGGTILLTSTVDLLVEVVERKGAKNFSTGVTFDRIIKMEGMVSLCLPGRCGRYRSGSCRLSKLF